MRRTSAAAALAVWLACAIRAQGRDEYTRDFEKTMPIGAGQRVDIDHRLGGVTVRTHARPDVIIRAAIRTSARSRADARDAAERIQIMVDQISTAVRVRTDYPEVNNRNFFGNRDISFSVNYDILMPRTVPLVVRNRFGNVDVAGVEGGAEIEGSNGRVTVADVSGKQMLTNRFGNVSVTSAKGDVAITNSNGSVDVRSVSGTLDVSNRFGAVTIDDVGRALVVRGGNGGVTVTKVGGTATVSNQFAGVNLRDVGGAVSVTNRNGSIVVRDARGSAALETSFGRIDAEGIAGTLTVVNRNGSVNASRAKAATIRTSFGTVSVDGLEGPLEVQNHNGAVNATRVKAVKVETSFGGVTVDGAEGAVDITNRNGAIRAALAGGSRGCQPVTLSTAFGGIQISVPAAASYDLKAHASFGRIKSELPLQVVGVVGSNALEGKLGSGGCAMTLTNRNGAIDILRAVR